MPSRLLSSLAGLALTTCRRIELVHSGVLRVACQGPQVAYVLG